MVKKVRMTADTPEKGQYRSEIISATIGRYREALEKGFYLEAITIAESLIADRLESRAVFLGKNDAMFSTIGKLCGKLEDDDPILSDLLPSIRDWADGRNKALHALAKIEDGDVADFEDKYAATKDTAEAGLIIFRKLDSALKKLRSTL